MRVITEERLQNNLFSKIQSNALKNGGCHWDVYKNWCIRGEEIEQAIKDIFAEDGLFKPTIDIDIVRCKDCKHWKDGVAGCTDHVKLCEFGYYMVGENGYCVYGERG